LARVWRLTLLFTLAAAAVLFYIQPQPLHADADVGRGLVLLWLNVSDRCGDTLQVGEEGVVRLLLLYQPHQQVAEYVSLRVLLVSPDGASSEVWRTVWGPLVLPGESKLLAFNLTMPPSASPGNYKLLIRYNIVYLDGDIYSSNITAVFPVEGCPSRGLRLSAHLEPYSYPGTLGARLIVRISNPGNESLANITFRLSFPEGWRPRSYTGNIARLEPNTTASFTVDNIYIPVWLQPGTVSLPLNISYSCSLCDRNVTISKVIDLNVTIERAPPLHLALLHYGWADGYAYTGESNTLFAVTLQLLEPVRVTGVNYSLVLPPGFCAEPGSPLRGFMETVLGYGSSLRLEFRLQTPEAPGCYDASLVLRARIEDNGTTVWRPAFIPLTLCVMRPSTDVTVTQAYWETWVAGPRGYDLSARLRLLYTGNDTLERLVANATALPPAGIRGGTTAPTITAVPASRDGIVELSVPGVVVPPGTDHVVLSLRGYAVLATPSGGVYRAPLGLRVVLPVPQEEPLQLLWANYTTPHIVRGAGRIELQVRLANNGSVPLQILWLEPEGLPTGVSFMGASGGCLATTLPSGSACTATISLNVSEAAPLGRYGFMLRVAYSYRTTSSLIEAESVFPLNITIEDPVRYAPRFILVTAYWASATGEPIPVLPGDRGARLVVTVLNNGTVAATNLVASLEGWNSTSTVCAAVPPGGSCSAVLYATPRPDIEPSLVLRYTAEPYGSRIHLSQRIPLHLPLADPAKALIVDGVEWLSPPEPGSRTAKLGVALKPDPSLVESIVSVRLVLPEGLSSPQTGHIAYMKKYTLPSAGLAAVLEQLGGRQAARLATLLQGSTPDVTGGNSLYVADIAVDSTALEAPAVALLVVKWRSAAGTLHETKYRLVLPPPESASMLVVESGPRAPMKGGVANLTLSVTNAGNGPAYNVYLILASLSQTGFPAKPVIALGKIEPGETRKITVPIVFNPASFTGTKTYTFAGLAALVYDDTLGFKRFINATVSAVLEPVIRIVVEKLRVAEGQGGYYLTGVVANMGLEVASSVTVTAYCGQKVAKEFLGNLDPGTETPFKLSLGERGVSCSTVLVIVEYLDEYGYRYRVNASVPAEPVKPAETPTAATTATLSQSRQGGEGGVSSVLFTGRLLAALGGGFVAGLAVAALRRRRSVEEELLQLEEGGGT